MSLIILVGFSSILSAQTKINGIINKYGRVTSIGVDFVIVNDVTQFNQFHAGDTVLLMQMKGVRIYPTEDPSYGSSGFSYGETGKHEFLVILSVEGATRKIVFRNNIVTPGFDVSGNVQIIKVPSYNYAKVDGILTCAPWDSATKTGGVLTAIFGRTLSLDANIDVSGKGFKGGEIAPGQGICMATNVLWERYAYSATSDSAGFKGEGLAINVDPSGINNPPFFPVFHVYAKGQGRNFNGGGGGNGKFSGGGGGSNYGVGGKGGNEQGPCSPVKPGGLGGIQIPGTGLEGGIFLGGGGGGSTNQGGTPSTGANGGGIIILICDTLKGNSRNILADGATPVVTASGNAGAGGGGGGGSIALYLQTYLTNLTPSSISANGGKGGNNTSTFGEGGGGGGGYINTNSFTIPGGVSKTVNGGAVGSRSGGSTGGPGFSGTSITTFIPILNGFLFNSIISSENGAQIDSICSNIIPKKITGTTPVGGSGNYNFEWLKSLSSTGPWISIASGPTLKDYAPTAPEPVTFWIRRFVKDNVTLLQDTSKAVKIVVQPAITGNNIGSDTTICYGQDPLKLRHIGTPSGGYDNFHYRWYQNTTNNWSSYSSAVGTDLTNGDFDPSSLNMPTYYKRAINAGHCNDLSATTITITVLPSITNNILNSHDTIICEGSLFELIKAKQPGGGSSSYIYKWQEKLPSTSWTDIPSTDVQNYLPDISKFNSIDSVWYYRRIVYSGPNNTCFDFGAQVKRTRFPKIINNAIGPTLQTICSGKIPTQFTQTLTLSGGKEGAYDYEWHDSTSITTGPVGTNSPGYSPPALTITTWYWRVVNSSRCKSKSNIISVLVQPAITNNTISLRSGLADSTICYGATPKKLLGKIPPALAGGDGSVYTYKWKYSTDNTNWNYIPAEINPDYQPASAITSTTWYQRVVKSGTCADSVNSVRINLLQPIVNTIPAAKNVCINTASTPVTGLSLSGGKTNQYKFLWESSPDGTAWTNTTPDTIRTISGADLDLPLLSAPVKYRRKVWSGPYNTCFSTSNIIDISIDQIPYPIYAGRDTILHTFEYLYRLQAYEPVLGHGTWSKQSSPNELTFDDNTLYNTTVRNLASFDPNVLLWTVENGVCKLDTTVSIEILNIDIPGGISPGDDGKNDLMIIKGLDFTMDGLGGKPSQSIELRILNSAGTEVFHTSNINGNEWKNWDGKDDGGIDLPEGTYYYLLKIQSNRTNKPPFKQTGFIILKRY